MCRDTVHEVESCCQAGYSLSMITALPWALTFLTKLRDTGGNPIVGAGRPADENCVLAPARQLFYTTPTVAERIV